MAFLVRIIDLTMKLSLDAYFKDPHTGTHIDAPAYVIRGQKTIDQLGLEVFMVDAVLLDLTGKARGDAIDDEDLEAAEEAAGLAVREGEAALLHTSVSGDASKPHPYLSRNGADYLEFRRVSMVGIDASSIDNPADPSSPAHNTLLSMDILVLEGLSNLDKIELSRFRLAAFPLRLKAATSPVRAIAIVDE
jgi:kynurenine formamidase